MCKRSVDRPAKHGYGDGGNRRGCNLLASSTPPEGYLLMPTYQDEARAARRWCQFKIVSYTRNRIEQQGLTAMLK